MRNFEDLFEALSRSRFRSRFALNAWDRDYVTRKTRGVIRQHARDFVQTRLSTANPTQRWQANPHARPSRLPRSACHSDLLP